MSGQPELLARSILIVDNLNSNELASIVDKHEQLVARNTRHSGKSWRWLPELRWNVTPKNLKSLN
jgi:hypothetical protein